MKLTKAAGGVFLGSAVLLNERFLAGLISPDGRIETPVHRLTIAYGEIGLFLIGLGFLLLPGWLSRAPRVQRRRTFKWLALGSGLFIFGAVVLAHQSYIHLNAGLRINKVAWIATYTDRGLTPPPEGPRSGYWVSRIASRAHPDLGWVYQPLEIPGVLRVDPEGFQSAGVESGSDHHLLILGGSVAFGIYASDEANAYFSVMGRALEERKHRPRISVLSTGAWCSRHELAALKLRGLKRGADSLLLLDGLNDLVFEVKYPKSERVAHYLDNVRQIRDQARESGMVVILALQPSITEKRVLSRTERRIVELSTNEKNSLEVLSWCIPRMRDGLAALAAEDDGTWFVDLSEIFREETRSTFTDLWHLSDVGHEPLGRILAERVEEILYPDPGP